MTYSKKNGLRDGRSMNVIGFVIAVTVIQFLTLFVGANTALADAPVVMYNEIHGAPSEAGSYCYQTLGRERVLLMNVDNNPTCKVTFESIAYNQGASLINRRKYEAFWTYVETDTVSLYNLKNNSSTELHVSKNGVAGDRLWSLLHCRHGNTHSSDAAIQKVSNYLPHSTTSVSIGTTGSTAATDDTAGQIVMQNTPDAQVVSSCYPDGIGTVYFDAVNGFYEYENGQVAVEVAYGVWKTNSTGRLIKENPTLPDDFDLLETDETGALVAPDDAHCDEVRDHGEVVDPRYETVSFGRVAWVRANLVSRWRRGDASGIVTNSVLKLDKMTKSAGLTTAGSVENFHRVWAPIADPAINPDLEKYARGPLRFRIKRVDDPHDVRPTIDLDGTGLNTTTSRGWNGLILIDNVIASYPPMKAWAIPEGEYVPSGKKNVIGWTGAVSPVKYPSVGATGLKAAAGLAFATNNPPGARSGWIGETKASMTYRWRYMDQIIDEWKPIDLAMEGDRLVSVNDIDLTNLVGDVEFKYEVTLDAPYYDYLDYSGSTQMGAPAYCERIAKVTSALNPEARGQGNIPLTLPSGGSDFFFRLRSGASEQLEYRIEVCGTGSTAILMTAPCWLVADNTWKTYLKTTTNATSSTALTKGDYRFRVCGVKPDVTFGGETAMTQVPWTAQRLVRVDDPEWGWTAFTVDSATDALMFKIAEDPECPDEMTYTVVHASFQDFNSWTDAITEDGLYTGAYFEGRGKRSGSSPDVREYPCELASWNPISARNGQYWTENFIPLGCTPLDGFDGYRAYTQFPCSWTPNGWEAINSMWVCSKYRESAMGDDMALHLGGFGFGSLEYVNTAVVPHGIDQVNFKARVAKSLEFDSFAYYLGAPISDLKDYVFSTRAVMSTTDAATDFDGNGSISLVGYYQPGTGCYELRAERIATNAIRLYLYKWVSERGGMRSKLLGYHTATLAFRTQTYLRCSNKASSVDEQSSGYFGNLFIRCQTTAEGQSKIIAGVLNGEKRLSDEVNASHYCISYTDDGTNVDLGPALTYGTFGFASVNCPARIIKPMFYANGNTGIFPNVVARSYSVDATGKQITVTNPMCGSGTVSYPSGGTEVFVTRFDGKYANWVYSNWDYENEIIADSYYAVRAAEPYGEVELSVTANGQNTVVSKMPVNGYKYNEFSVAVRNTADSLVKIATGEYSDDIVIDNVSFNQWSAGSYIDGDNYDFWDKLPAFGSPTNFVYVNGWVRLMDEMQHVIDLQPMRAVYDTGLADYKAVSVRAPLMDGRDGRGRGLGLLNYTYKDADPRCRVLVQYRDDIEGTEYLNSYTRSTAGWKTVAVNDFSSGGYDLKGGTITTYVGAHDARGAMRIIVDPQVVRDAQSVDKNPERDPAYGQITITDFRATDEPALDGMCWWGWNFRTTEDPMERSIVDSVDGRPGLALALNNSVSDQIEQKPGESKEDCRMRYAQNLPFVQTPTFYTNLIGEISFSARRMSEDDPVTEVAILGATDGGANEPTEWKWLKTIVVDSATYKTYSYKASAGDEYRAFRIAVIGVAGVEENYVERMAVPPPPPRVLIDDVSVSESVSELEPPTPVNKPRVVCCCGFEELAEGEEGNFGQHVFCPQDAGIVASHGGQEPYPGVLPYPFTSSGKNYLQFRTGTSELKIGAGEMSGDRWGEPVTLDSCGSVYFDALVNLTVLDDEPELPIAKSAVAFSAIGGGGHFMRPSGCVVSLDDKMSLYALDTSELEWYDDPRTNLCLVAGRINEVNGQVEKVTHLLSFADGSGVPDMADLWRRLTVQMLEQDGTGVIVFRVFVDGLLLCNAEGEAEFPSLCQNDWDGRRLYGASFRGRGSVDDVVFAEGEPGFVDVAGAMGDPNRDWASSGDAEWFVDWDAEKQNYVARSGAIGDSQVSRLKTEVMNGGMVSFDVRTSCEKAFRGFRTDGLTFYVDGAEVAYFDGETGWSNFVWQVKGNGIHLLEWVYEKDIEGRTGDDGAFLSGFSFHRELLVSFDANGATSGEPPTSLESYSGGTIVLPDVGTLLRAKHSFGGWSDGSLVFQAGEEYVLGDVALEFKAVWQRKLLSDPVIHVPERYQTEKTLVRIDADSWVTVHYTLDGTEPTIQSPVYTGEFEIVGSMTIRCVAVCKDWFDSGVASVTTVRAPWTFGECLNVSNLTFTCGGSRGWVRDLEISHDSVASMRSGMIGNNEASWISTTVSGEGILHFWWRASSESFRGHFFDYGVLKVDNEELDLEGVKIGGETDWIEFNIAITGTGSHVIQWLYCKDDADDEEFVGKSDCIWLDEVVWTPSATPVAGPTIEGDDGATVTGDAETGFVVKPGEGKTAVEVTIPQGVDAAKVTVEVSPKVASVKPNGAKVKVVSGGADITEYLNVPAADGNGVVNLAKATVKEDIVKEAMDTEKGAKIELNAADPKLITPNTRVGLFYTFSEGRTLGGMERSASKTGDGKPWSPEVKVKGGNSAFYSIGVGKGE